MRGMGIAHELITRGWNQGGYWGEDGAVCIGKAAQLQTNFPAALEAVARVIGCTDRFAIPAWNDAPERTFDEVLRVAKEADELLDA